METISVLAVWAALFSAIAALFIALLTKRSLEAPIIIQLAREYASPEMNARIRCLREWKEAHGADYAKEFGRLRTASYATVKDIDNDRRQFVHFFHLVNILLSNKVVTKCFVKRTISVTGVAFLLDVIEPMEAAIRSNYDRSVFVLFRELYRKELERGEGEFHPPDLK